MSKLKELRKAAGYTQDKVASQLKVKQASVCNWEKGKFIPRLEKLQALSEPYMCDIDVLYDACMDSSRRSQNAKNEASR